jgi:hypothetical protein
MAKTGILKEANIAYFKALYHDLFENNEENQENFYSR